MEKRMRLGTIAVLACAFFASVALSGAARAGDTPSTLTGAKSVGADEVAKAQAAGAVVIDSRVASEYADGHIKGAISVPYREKSEKSASFDASQDEFNVAKLPADKAAPIVIYCNGPECWKSYKASSASIKAGYTNILWYREGFPDWKSKNRPIAAAD
jgi:rhodanese-related sulfurtransferase